MSRTPSAFCCLAVFLLTISACGSNKASLGSGGSGGSGGGGSSTYQLTVLGSGTGKGTISSSPSGISCGSTCSAAFAAGTVVTLTETPASGAVFAGWSGACSGTSTCQVTMNSSQSVTATFNPVYQLTVQNSGTGAGTVTSNPSGINCGSTCSASFAPATAVTLTAAPATGSVFAGWSGACTGTSTCQVTINANTSVTATFNPAPTYQLTIKTSGSGTGTVTSSPAGISCGSTCSANYSPATAVTLTAAPGSSSTFGGWSGACTGTSTCQVTLNANTAVTATFNPAGSISSINHVVILVQENRSLDNYLGALRAYWKQNGIPDQSFDGLPQFNPTTGAAPLQGPAPSIAGCNPSSPSPNTCIPDPTHPVTSFHLLTMCTENTSPSWDEAHNDWDYNDPVGNSTALNNGFVFTAAYDARANSMYDTSGTRAMGYYDGADLNFLYFMASNFATSDRFFHPAMSRTNINREYLLGGTSAGYAYPNGTTASDSPLISSKTIFEDLQNAGVTWKIYVNTTGSSCTTPYTASCLMTLSYLQNFTYSQTVINQYPQNIQPIQQYFTDLQNGTLPQVAEIEPASDAGLDEHGSDTDVPADAIDVQQGEAYAESLINALMNSSSWADSALFLTYDESGGLYDHVPPQPMPSPDDIKPVDLLPGDICTTATGPNCDFVFTGYRIPLVVISPYAKKNYVSHTVADYTAILKFIETRWNLKALTKRDAAQMDMTEFFDFANPPWMTPPTPPAQNVSGPCYLDHLP